MGPDASASRRTGNPSFVDPFAAYFIISATTGASSFASVSYPFGVR
jgi:hypothetical protein